jgi:hypothetical protein
MVDWLSCGRLKAQLFVVLPGDQQSAAAEMAPQTLARSTCIPVYNA